MAELPLPPSLGAALLASAETGCAREVAAVAALLSVRSVWVNRRGEEALLDEEKARHAASCMLRWGLTAWSTACRITGRGLVTTPGTVLHARIRGTKLCLLHVYANPADPDGQQSGRCQLSCASGYRA